MASRPRRPPSPALALLVCALGLAAAPTPARGAEYLVTQQVFLDVAVGEQPADRITLGLFGEAAPRTVANFVALATAGVGGRSYKGAVFHRVIRKFMIQGGDVMRQDGTGSTSLYGDSFADETFAVKHSAPGMLSMANAGKDTNGCQFFITTVGTPWLDNLHVAFGKVVDGMAVVHKIENTATDSDDRPLRPVVIVDSGLVPTPTPFVVNDELYDIWEWIRSASVPLAFSFSVLAFFHWMIRQLDLVVEKQEQTGPTATITTPTEKSESNSSDDSQNANDELQEEVDPAIRKRKVKASDKNIN